MSENKDLYITVMFPYPSGSGLHAGHWYNYSIIDSYCRYKK
jgi:leucyl-tRNA synthetase